MNFILLIIALTLFIGCGWVQAKTYLTQQQALAAFATAKSLERKTVFLTPAQIQKIQNLARVKIDSSLVTYYVAQDPKGAVREIAFFDKRIVRTMPVVYMVALTPSGKLEFVDILSLEEPQDYLPPSSWLHLYKNRSLNDDLAIGHAIPNITGASLSSQAMNDGIRLLLATYEVAIKPSVPGGGA